MTAETAYVLTDCAPVVVICSAEFQPTVHEAVALADLNNISLIVRGGPRGPGDRDWRTLLEPTHSHTPPRAGHWDRGSSPWPSPSPLRGHSVMWLMAFYYVRVGAYAYYAVVAAGRDTVDRP